MDLSVISANLEDLASATKGIEEQLVLLNKLLAQIITRAPEDGNGALNIEVYGRSDVEVQGTVHCINESGH